MNHKSLYDLTIVIPAYREERRIGRTLDELARFLKRDPFWRQHSVEVLVVAADAPDNTYGVLEDRKPIFAAQNVPFTVLLPGPMVGKGRDVQYGMLRARGNTVLFMDADLAAPLCHMEEFYTVCMQGTDVIVGTRNLLTYRHSKLRSIFAHLGNLLYQAIGGVKVEDTQCGFKMFSRRAAQLCFTKLTILGWGFDQEVLAIAKANNIPIRPVRIDDWIDKPYSTYTDGVLRIATRSIHDFVRIRTNVVRGTYVRQSPKPPIH